MDNVDHAALFGSVSSRAVNRTALHIRDGENDDTENVTEFGINPWTITSDIAPRSSYTVFNTFGGSYIMDWNSAPDNFMKAFLANDGYALTARWAGGVEPYVSHHMAMGETVGFSHLISQVGFTGDLDVGIWESLLGDPTLRMHIVIPPSNVTVDDAGMGQVEVHWDPSPEDGDNGGTIPSTEFQGYYVYKASEFDDSFERVDSIGSNGLVDGASPVVFDGSINDIYIVRAVKREITPSGTYYNASQGAFSENRWESMELEFAADYSTATASNPIDLSDPSITFGTPELQFRTYRTSGVTIDDSDVASIASGQQYEVRLYLIATDVSSSIDITIENAQLLADYNISADIGEFAGIVKSFHVAVGVDDDLDIVIGGDNPFLSAIEVVGPVVL